MEKIHANALAVKIAAKILITDAKYITGSFRGKESANLVADFIQTLSSRLENDIESNLSSAILDKS